MIKLNWQRYWRRREEKRRFNRKNLDPRVFRIEPELRHRVISLAINKWLLHLNRRTCKGKFVQPKERPFAIDNNNQSTEKNGKAKTSISLTLPLWSCQRIYSFFFTLSVYLSFNLKDARSCLGTYIHIWKGRTVFSQVTLTRKGTCARIRVYVHDTQSGETLQGLHKHRVCVHTRSRDTHMYTETSLCTHKKI